MLQGKSNSPETRKKDLLASLCHGLQVHGINLVLDDSEDSAVTASSTQIICFKKKPLSFLFKSERFSLHQLHRQTFVL